MTSVTPVRGSLAPAMAQRIEIWPLDRLVPYARNPPTHSPCEAERKFADAESVFERAQSILDQNSRVNSLEPIPDRFSVIYTVRGPGERDESPG